MLHRGEGIEGGENYSDEDRKSNPRKVGNRRSGGLEVRSWKPRLQRKRSILTKGQKDNRSTIGDSRGSGGSGKTYL